MEIERKIRDNLLEQAVIIPVGLATDKEYPGLLQGEYFCADSSINSTVTLFLNRHCTEEYLGSYCRDYADRRYANRTAQSAPP
jgi:hypothetical protein